MVDARRPGQAVGIRRSLTSRFNQALKQFPSVVECVTLRWCPDQDEGVSRESQY